MPSVERTWLPRRRTAALALLCAVLAGCASLDDAEPSKVQTDKSDASVPVAAAAPAAASAAAKSAAAASAPELAKAPPAVEPAVDAVDTVAPRIELAPVDPAVQRAFDAAGRLLRAGRAGEAERAYMALTQSNPELGGPYANLGLIYGKAGKLAEAVAALEQAVKASPRQPVYFNQLGIAYRHIGQFTKAKQAYEKAIELDASYAVPYLNLAILNDLYLWDSKHALEYYDRYLALAQGQDSTVSKWVADLKNRMREHGSTSMVSKQERQ